MFTASEDTPPSTVNLTVKRRYLTEKEIERLMDCARKHGRYGHRDATMILVAYRHGLQKQRRPARRNRAGLFRKIEVQTNRRRTTALFRRP